MFHIFVHILFYIFCMQELLMSSKIPKPAKAYQSIREIFGERSAISRCSSVINSCILNHVVTISPVYSLTLRDVFLPTPTLKVKLHLCVFIVQQGINTDLQQLK